MAAKLLDGFKALDLTDEKGFLCGKILADMGVDVIKVERPGGDPARNIPPYYHDEVNPEKSLYWFAYNNNKRSVVLDLETSQDKDLFKRLVKMVDYIIESFPPGYMKKLGLSYEELSVLNPRLIMASITPYGQTGPYAHYKASDISIQALGVLLSQQGDPDRAPVRTAVPQAYMHAGAEAAEAILVAHYHRGFTGEGQYIDFSAMESVTWVAGRTLPFWDAQKIQNKRTGNIIVFSGRRNKGIWECKDGYISFILQGGTNGARTNKRLTEWMASKGMAPDFMKDKDWENWDWAATTQPELDYFMDAVDKFLRAHTKAELHEGANKRDIMLNPVCDSRDTVNNVQLKAREFWVDLKHEELNDTVKYPGAFAKLSLTPLAITRPAPTVGQHTEEILKELELFEKQTTTSGKAKVADAPRNTSSQPRKKALEGLKVVGLATAGVGPLLLKVLATHGASVIIIESMQRPNITRTGAPFKDNINGINRSFSFAHIMSDKYSLALDLKHPRAKEVTDRLVRWADLLVDNYRPGVTEKLGLSYEQVKTIKPDIISISLTHEGHSGPHRLVAGAGAILSGYSGLVYLTGWPDRPPVTMGAQGILPDLIAPRFGAAAALAALDYKRRTGQGQFIDLSEYESVIQFLSPALLDYSVNDRIDVRDGNKSLHAAPHGVYQCKGDDKWCAIAVFTESEWNTFCTVLGNPPWTKDKKFSTLAQRIANEDELDKLVETWTINYSKEDVMMMMQNAGIDAGQVHTIGEAVDECPQLKHRKYWWALKHPEIGDSKYAGSSYTLSKTPYKLEQPAPCFGEHTEMVCTRFLGMKDDEFISLLQEGVFK